MAFRDGKRTCILCGAGGGDIPDVEDITQDANCLAGDTVGDMVYVTGPAVGERLQVTQVDVTDRSTMPSIGIIIEKTSPTECVIQTEGPLAWTGLTPGQLYYVGLDAQLSTEVPSPPLGGIALAQIVGYALDDDILLVRPELDLVEATDARFALGISFEADCQSTDAVEDYVYIVGAGAVTKVNILDEDTMPAVGVIVEKLTDTRCRVQTIGELTTATAIVAGNRYWINTSARLSAAPPTPPVGGYIMAQVVGVAFEPNTLILRPDMQAVRLQG